MKIVSGRIVVTTIARSVIAPRRVSRGRPVAVRDAELRREPRVHLDARLGVLIDQRADAARLRAGEELADDAAGGEEERILVARRRRPAGGSRRR